MMKKKCGRLNSAVIINTIRHTFIVCRDKKLYEKYNDDFRDK
jgi:hypothetical protein